MFLINNEFDVCSNTRVLVCTNQVILIEKIWKCHLTRSIDCYDRDISTRMNIQVKDGPN